MEQHLKDTRSLFDESVELRTEIQNEHRSSYKELKRIVKHVTNVEPTDFKFIVDMYHYRSGGYPKPTSKPKHHIIIEDFINLVKWFRFLDLEHVLNLEANYGITVTIKEDDEIQDEPITGDELTTIREFGFAAKTKKEFLLEALHRGDNIQCEICTKSDLIKENAKILDKNEVMKKKHFTNVTTLEYRRREATRTDDTGEKLKKIDEKIDKEFESYSLSLTLIDEENGENQETAN